MLHLRDVEEERFVLALDAHIAPLRKERSGVDVRSLIAVPHYVAVQCNEHHRDAEEEVTVRIWAFHHSKPQRPAIVPGLSII